MSATGSSDDQLRAAGGDVDGAGGERRAAASRLHLNPEIGRYAKELPPVLLHTCSVVGRAAFGPRFIRRLVWPIRRR